MQAGKPAAQRQLQRIQPLRLAAAILQPHVEPGVMVDVSLRVTLMAGRMRMAFSGCMPGMALMVMVMVMVMIVVRMACMRVVAGGETFAAGPVRDQGAAGRGRQLYPAAAVEHAHRLCKLGRFGRGGRGAFEIQDAHARRLQGDFHIAAVHPDLYLRLAMHMGRLLAGRVRAGQGRQRGKQHDQAFHTHPLLHYNNMQLTPPRAGSHIPAPARHAMHVRFDLTAAWLGLGCAVHCMALPLILSLLPGAMMALRSFHHPWHGTMTWLLRLSRWEWVFALAAAVLCLASTTVGWYRHRHLLPPALAAAGSSALLLASLHPRIREALVLHGLLSAAGGALMMTAHLRNRWAIVRAPR